MNKDRRKRIDAVWSELEAIIEEEQESLDNLPENLQCSTKADEMEGYINNLEESRDSLLEIVSP